MKKSWIILGVIALVLLFGFMYVNNTYDKAVKLQEKVDKSWGNVSSTYQRRADLIPNLVATVKGAAENEKAILTQVTAYRSGISTAKDPQDLDAIGKKINSSITLMFEAYPQIRSTENFQGLQAQLEGTENRINVARDDYNQSVMEYNSHIRGLVRKLALSLSGGDFQPKKSFEAAKGTENAPEVNFK